MPSPFPGMDPFIEGPTHWSDFHPTLIGKLRESLNARLPRNYVARVDEHVMSVNPVLRDEVDDPAYLPDVSILKKPGTTASTASPDMSSGLATLELTAVTVQNINLLDPHTEVYIKIVRLPDMEVVSLIELLSPTNKYGEGRGEYMQKRRELLTQPINLVEVDLHRAGVSLEFDRPLPPSHYRAFVSRAGRRPQCEVYAWSIRSRLPTIPIPLRAPDADVMLDLGGPFSEAYQVGRYREIIDYLVPPPAPRFSAEDLMWMGSLLKKANAN